MAAMGPHWAKRVAAEEERLPWPNGNREEEPYKAGEGEREGGARKGTGNTER